MLQSGGNGGANFKWNGASPNCVDDPSATTDPNRPIFSASCYGAGPTNTVDIGNYFLSKWSPASVGESVQLNVQASASFGRIYHVGQGFGTLEFGGKARNGHKFDDSYTTTYTVNKGVVIPVAPFAGSFTDSSYYDNSYPWPSKNVDYLQVQNFVLANPNLFARSGGPGPNSANYDLTERVTAGYVMNSVDLTPRARLVAGVR